MEVIHNITVFDSESLGQRLVAEDVVRALARHFAPRNWVIDAGGIAGGPDLPTLVLDPEIHPDGSPLVAAQEARETVSWLYRGLYYRKIFGVAPSGLFVTISGTTVVRLDARPDPLLHRFVNWLDVMSSMGVTLSGRPLIDGPTAGNLDKVQERLPLLYDQAFG